MGLTTDAIPNRPLTGHEVMKYALALTERYSVKYGSAKLCGVEMNFTMNNPALPRYSVVLDLKQEDTILCPQCKGEDNLECEVCCMERRIENTPAVAMKSMIEAARRRMESDWVFGANLTYPKIRYEITLFFLTANKVIAKKSLTGEVDNPNLVRVHFGLPINQVEKILPTEDNPMGGLQFKTLVFDASQYPEPVEPVESDLTPEVVIAGEDFEPEDDEEDEEESEVLTEPVAVGAVPVDRAPRQRRKKA